MFKAIFTAAFLAAATILPAQATVLHATHYDGPNGYSGGWPYWDKNYTGSGNTTLDGAPLTGGSGDLTDGIIATKNYYASENAQGTGPYVGWRIIDPVITFFFGQNVTIDSVTLYANDDNGFGNAGGPRAVTMAMSNITKSFSVVQDSDYAVDVLNFVDLDLTGDSLTLQLFRNYDGVMISEVVFNGSVASAVPAPAAVGLLGMGLAATAFVRRRRIG